MLNTDPDVLRIRFIVSHGQTKQQCHASPSMNEYVLHALKLKTAAMPARDKLVSIVLDEMGIKEGVSYDEHRDNIEGLKRRGS